METISPCGRLRRPSTGADIRSDVGSRGSAVANYPLFQYLPRPCEGPRRYPAGSSRNTVANRKGAREHLSPLDAPRSAKDVSNNTGLLPTEMVWYRMCSGVHPTTTMVPVITTMVQEMAVPIPAVSCYDRARCCADGSSSTTADEAADDCASECRLRERIRQGHHYHQRQKQNKICNPAHFHSSIISFLSVTDTLLRRHPSSGPGNVNSRLSSHNRQKRSGSAWPNFNTISNESF